MLAKPGRTKSLWYLVEFRRVLRTQFIYPGFRKLESEYLILNRFPGASFPDIHKEKAHLDGNISSPEKKGVSDIQNNCLLTCYMNAVKAADD